MDDTSPQGKQQFNMPASARSLLKDEFSEAFDTLQAHCAFLNGRVDALSAKLEVLEDALSHERSTVAALEEALAAEQVKTQAAAAVRSQFLDNMSHELRTPLNGILGMTQLLLDMPLSYEIKDNAQAIFDSGQLLENVISHLLDYSRLLQGDFPLQSDEFNLLEHLERIIQQHAPATFDKGLDVQLNAEKGLFCTISADEKRLAQVVSLLLQNAIKFTVAGTIQVTANVESDTQKPTQSNYTLRITDTGIGLEASQKALAFEPFWQAELSSARTHGGMGLGLSLCQQLVQHMGGTITLESEQNVGTSVHVSIPISRVASVPITPLAAPPRCVGLYNLDESTADSLTRYLRWLDIDAISLDAPSLSNENIARCDVVLQPFQPAIATKDDPLQTWFNTPAKHPQPLRVGILAPNRTYSLQDKKGFDLFIEKPLLFTAFKDTLKYAGTQLSKQKAPAEEVATTPNEEENRRILLVEPNKINQKILSYMLQSLGLTVDAIDRLDQTLIPEHETSYRSILINTMLTQPPTLDALLAFSKHYLLEDNHTIIGIRSKNAGADPAVFAEAGVSQFLTLPTNLDDVRALLAIQ